MSFTPPPAAPAASAPIPSRVLDDQPTFDTKTDTYLNWLATFRNWLATFVGWVGTFTSELTATQDQVQASALAATDASAVALAASNFKGLWASLAGALNKPACVKHNGRFWMLLNNLVDVATSQPGVSADWTSLDAGAPVTQVLSIAGATVNAVAGVTYILAAASITLVLPIAGTQFKGDRIGVRLATTAGTQILDFNANNYLGTAPGQRLIDINNFALDLLYEDATRGYI